jgi:hypothetical protein
LEGISDATGCISKKDLYKHDYKPSDSIKKKGNYNPAKRITDIQQPSGDSLSTAIS